MATRSRYQSILTLVAQGEDIGPLGKPGAVCARPELLLQQAETLRVAGDVHYARGRLEEAFVLHMRFVRIYDVIVGNSRRNPLLHVESLEQLSQGYASAVATIDEIDAKLREQFAAGGLSRPPSIVWSISHDDEQPVEGACGPDGADLQGEGEGEQPPRPEATRRLRPLRSKEELLARLRAALDDDVQWPSSRRETSSQKTSSSISQSAHDISKPSSTWRAADGVRQRVRRATVISAAMVQGGASSAANLRSSLGHRLEQGTKRLSSRLRRVAIA